jgi:hypothetical protein
VEVTLLAADLDGIEDFVEDREDVDVLVGSKLTFSNSR